MKGFRAVMASAVLIAFIVFCVFLVLNADTKNASEWERWVYVFGAAEAIAFAGLGWVFGREINRERAVNAEESAAEAHEEAKDEKAKGAALAGLVKGAQAAPPGGDLEPMGPGAAPAGGLASAVAFAEKHYGLD